MEEGTGGPLAGRSNRILGLTRHRLCSSSIASVVLRTDSHPRRPLGRHRISLPSAFLTVGTCLRATLKNEVQE
jgi:hypothetical protein